MIGNNGEPNIVYQNTGNGVDYTKIIFTENEYSTYDIQFADIDNDGYLDIIESNSDEMNLYYFNLIPRMKE